MIVEYQPTRMREYIFTKQNASFEATLFFLNKKKYEINLCIVILIDIFDEIGL